LRHRRLQVFTNRGRRGENWYDIWVSIYLFFLVFTISNDLKNMTASSHTFFVAALYNLHAMKNIVGKNVARIRQQLGITQEGLAVRLQMAGWRVDRFLVSKIERGERQVLDSEVLSIANVLKVSINSLFGRDK